MRLFCVTALSLFLAVPAFAQSNRGTITGTVTEGTGPVSNATVHAVYTAGPNYAAGTEVNTTSTLGDGTFKVWALLPGTYRLDVSYTNPETSQTTTATVNDVTVTANANTAVGTVTLQ
jgi:hypothetical protein